jgi:hypothetical protein
MSAGAVLRNTYASGPPHQLKQYLSDCRFLATFACVRPCIVDHLRARFIVSDIQLRGMAGFDLQRALHRDKPAMPFTLQLKS